MRAAVLGSPIAHSLSPALHRAAYRWLGLDWSYQAVECTESELAALLDRCSAEGDWAGLSLTMPLKTAALGLVDTVDRVAELTSAVNTVVFAAGRRDGANTDVPGLVAALAERGVRAPRSVAVLGGGATARSAVAALAELGVAEVTAYLRRPEASADLAETGRRCGVTVRLAPWAEAAGGLGADLVISTAPAGAADPLADCRPGPPGGADGRRLPTLAHPAGPGLERGRRRGGRGAGPARAPGGTAGSGHDGLRGHRRGAGGRHAPRR